jgi:hypothetical protein
MGGAGPDKGFLSVNGSTSRPVVQPRLSPDGSSGVPCLLSYLERSVAIHSLDDLTLDHEADGRFLVGLQWTIFLGPFRRLLDPIGQVIEIINEGPTLNDLCELRSHQKLPRIEVSPRDRS